MLSLAVLASLLTAAAQAATSVSQYGITWRFSTDRPVGQYANGDWWVLGPVAITSITPGSTTTNGWTGNGTQVNPTPSPNQGFDSSIHEHSSVGGACDRSLNKNPSFTGAPLVLNAGSVVASISRSARAAGRPQLDTVAILTVVRSAPAAGSFRPGPSADRNTNRVSFWNKSQLDYSLLRSLAPVKGMPSLAEVSAAFQRPWVEFVTGSPARYLHALGNQPEYGRDIANRIGDALMSLHMNYTRQQKEALFVRLVQLGIDVYSAAQAGAEWTDLGGINAGRKAPLVLAALALNDAGMKQYADAAQYFIFQEDLQTWYVTRADVGRALYHGDGRQRDAYVQADVGLPEWGEQHTKQPDRDGRNWNAYYRDINNGAHITHALGMRLTQGALELWNWPAFFAYHDRAFRIDAPSAGGTNSMKVWERDAWNAYRNLSSSPTLLIDETFGTSPAASFTVGGNGGVWTVNAATGKYVLSDPYPGGASTANPNQSIHGLAISGNWTLTADASVAGTASTWNDFSVLFGYQNGTNSYYVSFNESNDGGTSGVFKIENGVRTQLADITAPIAANTTYAVKVVKNGSTYRVYRNNVLMATATDATWSRGKVGFGTLNDSATFDNLAVASP